MSTQERIQVLIVDDIPETRENLRKLLFFETDIEAVGTASGGEEAIERTKELLPDVVLMDINMPGLDGITASEIILQDIPAVQIVIMSVQSESNYLRRAMMVGAQDFLIKPFTRDEMTSTIRRVHQLGRAQSLRRMQAEETALKIAETRERLELYASDSVRGHLVDRLGRLAVGTAHDMRSPLSIIQDILDTSDAGTNTGLETYLQRIGRQCQRCQWTANNFLGISFHEKMALRRVRLLDVVADSLELFEDRLSPSLALSIQVPKDLTVRADTKLLHMALANLASNAIEAMPDGGRLTIGARKDGSQVWVVVRDSGSGVPEEVENHLFDLGFTTKPGHSGVGLYVARRLMRQQLGDVRYGGKGGGAGSLFAIRIPVDPAIHSDPRDLEKMEVRLEKLEAQLRQARAGPRSREKEKRVSSEFERLTAAFARNLYQELAIVEVAGRKLTPRVPDETIRQNLVEIAQHCAYARLLTLNMVEIGKAAPTRWSSVSLVDVVESVLELLARKMPQDLYVDWEVDATLGDIEADETQLKQAFMNLVRNALDAMPEGGRLGIRLDREGEQAVAVVSDSGIGIPPESKSHIFELGFTTKPGGYGIGLYSTKNIILKHRGRIDFSSREGKGSAFTIHLPIRQ